MLKHRVIPTLLIKEGSLVKTKQFKNPRYIGDPVNAIRIFNEKEVDELVVLDIYASKRGFSPDFELVSEFASECFMPITYGGGIKNLDDATRLFEIGIEKICLQTMCFENLNLVKDMVQKFGSQSVVASVDAKKTILGKYKLFRSSKMTVVEDLSIEKHLQNLLAAEVGEIIFNCVHKDGTLSGPDLNILNKISDKVTIPLVAIGGVSSLKDIKDTIDAGADAVAAGAFFVYHGKRNAVLITYPEYKELEDLFST